MQGGYTMIKLKNLEITEVEKEDLIIFRLNGAIHTEIYTEFLTYLKEKINSRNIIIDFTRLTYMSSTGTGVLFNLNKIIHDQGRKLILFGLNESVQHVITLTRLNTTFIIVANEVEALRELK